MGYGTQGNGVRIRATVAGLDIGTLNSYFRELGVRVINDRDLRTTIGLRYLQQVTPYVPKKTGVLRASGRAENDGRIHWIANNPDDGFDYAAQQYVTEYGHYTTPNTGPYWVERVQPGTTDYNIFLDRITPYVIDTFNNHV